MAATPSAGAPAALATVCPLCRASTPANARFCSACGFELAARPAPGAPGSPGAYGPPGGPLTEPFARVPVPQSYSGYLPADKDRGRTDLGLTLLIIGFLLSWIPYVNYVGSVLALVGVLLVFLGRRAYGPEHHRFVVLGSVLVFLGVVGGFVASLSFTAAIVDEATTAGVTLAQIGSMIQGDLLGLIVASFVVGTLVRLGEILIVYRLSTRTARILLWTGFATGLLLGLATIWYLLPQIDTAISQATSGTQINLGPINRVENTSLVLSLSGVLPAVLFAWAYYLVRDQNRRPRSEQQVGQSRADSL